MIKVYDDEGLGAAELIGCTRVYLNDLEPGKLKNMWLKLVKDLDVQRDTKYRGEVITTCALLIFTLGLGS